MKKISLLALLLTVSVIAVLQACQSTSKAATSRMFKFNLEKGKGYDYEMVWDMETSAGGRNSNVGITGLFSMNITDENNGVKSITTSYKSFRMRMDVMGMHMDIDSDKPVVEAEGSELNPVAMMQKMVKGIVGKEFVIKVDEEGKVLEVTGFEKMMSGILDSLDLPEEAKAQATASMKDQFSDQTIKDQFAPVFTIFPNKEIKVGDTWTKNYSTGGRTAAEHSTKFTVKEIEGDHVTLATDTRISSSGKQDIDGSQTGTMIVDSKTGLMVNASFDQDLSVKAEGETVKVKGKGKIRGKVN